MNALFQEFAGDVLNIESRAASTLVMPGPFEVFLKKETTTGIEIVEHKRIQLKQYIDILQEKPKSIEKN